MGTHILDIDVALGFLLKMLVASKLFWGNFILLLDSKSRRMTGKNKRGGTLCFMVGVFTPEPRQLFL